MKIKHISMLISVLGITTLYVLSMLSQPPVIELCKIPNYEGKEIITQGVVKEHHKTRYGSQSITIAENNATSTVFVEGEIDVEFGDIIQVTGKVQKYKEGWEIIVDTKQGIEILEKWNNISSPLWQLANNPTKYLGLNINVSGIIDVIYDPYFYLLDFNSKSSLMVFYNNSNKLALQSGKKICVTGKFCFDEKNFRYYLKQCDESHKLWGLEDGG